ncbi:MAG TPA: isoprenylcysteine carboxylmethyltransferase family protein [Planctomycetota bacterium]|nr:isoprenylcysteine carboxylmethyltransferase family protein [Planctomycetota bacterium]
MSAVELGRTLFEHRRWVHPAFVLAALALGGSRPSGLVVGGALLLVLLAIRVWAVRYMGGAARVHARKAQESRVLLTVGPFAWVRNPLYLGNALGLAGACLLFGPPWFAALALVASLLWYRAIIGWEEQVLEGLYGQEYRDYLARVPRLLPRPPARVGAAPGLELYSWGKVIRRERGAVISVAVLLALSLLLEILVPFR